MPYSWYTFHVNEKYWKPEKKQDIMEMSLRDYVRFDCPSLEVWGHVWRWMLQVARARMICGDPNGEIVPAPVRSFDCIFPDFVFSIDTRVFILRQPVLLESMKMPPVPLFRK